MTLASDLASTATSVSSLWPNGVPSKFFAACFSASYEVPAMSGESYPPGTDSFALGFLVAVIAGSFGDVVSAHAPWQTNRGLAVAGAAPRQTHHLTTFYQSQRE